MYVTSWEYSYFYTIPCATLYCKLFEVESFVVVELIHTWTAVLYGESLLHRLFHCKSFTVTNQSVKTAKLINLKRFAIYSIILCHLIT